MKPPIVNFLTFLDGFLLACVGIGVVYFTVVVLFAGRHVGKRKGWW
jgi:hypothetical protein